VAAAEQRNQREGAAQPLHRLGHRLLGRHLALQQRGQELRHHLGVGVALEATALGQQLVLQLLEVLDDAVVHDRHPVGGDRMGIALGRLAVRRPAGMADPIVPASGSAPSRASRLTSLPSARRRSMWPFTRVATPAES
jgi:hypothetical protein